MSTSHVYFVRSVGIGMQLVGVADDGANSVSKQGKATSQGEGRSMKNKDITIIDLMSSIKYKVQVTSTSSDVMQSSNVLARVFMQEMI